MKKSIREVIKRFLPDDLLKKSIQQILGSEFQTDNRTNLTRRVSEAASKPMVELGTDDIVMLLRQDVGEELTLAIALMLISEEPLMCGDACSGDLLQLALQRGWHAWLNTEKYGVDPYGLISAIESTVNGLKDLCAVLEGSLKTNFFDGRMNDRT